jgi:hypothetical protein
VVPARNSKNATLAERARKTKTYGLSLKKLEKPSQRRNVLRTPLALAIVMAAS